MVDLNQIKITPRDQEVLNLLCAGCSNREIASDLRISERTVKQHLHMMFRRAGIVDGRKRVKLVVAAIAAQSRLQYEFLSRTA